MKTAALEKNVCGPIFLAAAEFFVNLAVNFCQELATLERDHSIIFLLVYLNTVLISLLIFFIIFSRGPNINRSYDKIYVLFLNKKIFKKKSFIIVHFCLNFFLPEKIQEVLQFS
jgi:hypothetical protein